MSGAPGFALAAAMLSLLALSSVSGCRRPPAPPPANTSGSIDTQRLLAVHPSWREVAELDRLITHMGSLSATLPAGTIPLPEATFPSPLQSGKADPDAPQPLPASAKQSADARIARLTASFKEHADRVLERERAANETRLAADVAIERARLKDQPVQRVIARTPEDERELKRLQLEAIALESQIRVVSGEALKAAQDRLDAVAARIKQLQAPPEVRNETREQAIEKQLETFRAARQSELEKAHAERIARTRMTSEQAVAVYKRGLEQKLADAAVPVRLSTPNRAAVRTRVIRSAATVSTVPSVTVGAKGTLAIIAGLREQRTRLVRVITDDLSRRLEGLAIQYHWTMVQPGEGVDLTSQAADLIRRQFAVER